MDQRFHAESQDLLAEITGKHSRVSSRIVSNRESMNLTPCGRLLCGFQDVLLSLFPCPLPGTSSQVTENPAGSVSDSLNRFSNSFSMLYIRPVHETVFHKTVI